MKILLLFLTTIALSCNCMAEPMNYDEHLARLRKNVPPKAIESEDRWVLKYGDFTGDGKDEMIAFVYEVTGRDEGMEWGQYYLYYSTQETLTICDTLDNSFYKAPRIFEIENSAIIFYTIGYGGPSGVSSCWRCTDDNLVPVTMPGELERLGNNYFRCLKSGFDSFKAEGGEEKTFSPGRCFYNYYYFFDGERFIEYGGTKISEQVFCRIPGATELLQKIRSEGYTIDNILYRANGIVDINCSYRTSKELMYDEPPKPGIGYCYIELQLTDTGFDSTDGLQPGRIKSANTPDAATYPEI